jgi:transposase-like protein
VDDISQEVSAQQVPAKRRRYADEFNQDAVRLIVEEKYPSRTAAEVVGVCEQTLRTWHAKRTPKSDPYGDDATVAEREAKTSCVDSD